MGRQLKRRPKQSEMESALNENEIPLSYQQARRELDELVAAMEGEDADIDVLGEKVRRACALIEWCQARLRATAEEVDKALKDFENRKAGALVGGNE